jgi:glycosyltransferase involved in cell wall biosynthesis
MKLKLFRITTIPFSLSILLKGQLKYLNRCYDVIAVSSRGTELEKVGKQEGVQTKAIDIERSISLFKDFVSLVKLYFYFRKEKPDIVHSITPKAGLLSMVAAKMAGVPMRIHTFTGLIFPYQTGFFQKLLIFMDKILCACATNIYPEGKGVMNDLQKFKITDKPLKVIANGNVNGIDTTHFNPALFSAEQKANLRKKLGIDGNDFVFVFVGRLVKDKGIDELVSTFSILNSQFPIVKLLLVGPFERELDPLLPTTEQEIQNNPHIISVGFQADVRPYLAISDIFVFPSYREGFPNVVMQAGAMELPCIVTDINGCNEIIIDGVNGLIIPPKNQEALKEKMELLIHDIDLRNRLKSNAREMITSRYEQKLVWEALLEEYKRLEKSK